MATHSAGQILLSTHALPSVCPWNAPNALIYLLFFITDTHIAMSNYAVLSRYIHITGKGFLCLLHVASFYYTKGCQGNVQPAPPK